jgi:hypothetical protein
MKRRDKTKEKGREWEKSDQDVRNIHAAFMHLLGT